MGSYGEAYAASSHPFMGAEGGHWLLRLTLACAAVRYVSLSPSVVRSMPCTLVPCSRLGSPLGPFSGPPSCGGACICGDSSIPLVFSERLGSVAPRGPLAWSAGTPQWRLLSPSTCLRAAKMSGRGPRRVGPIFVVLCVCRETLRGPLCASRLLS